MIKDEPQSERPKMPVWFSIVLIASMIAAVFASAAIGERYKKQRRDQQLIEDFSRLSDSPEIQEAYDRLHPIK